MKSDIQRKELPIRVIQSKVNTSRLNFIDNRLGAITQYKLISNIQNSMKTIPELQEGKCPIQRIAIGFEPSNPDDYRNITNVTSVGCFDWMKGGEEFPDDLKDFLLANNSNYLDLTQITAFTTGGIALASDVSYAGLVDQRIGSAIYPEIDHIIPYNIYGSNTPENARILSKQENNDSSIKRPTPVTNETVLKTYEDIHCDYMDKDGQQNLDFPAGSPLPDFIKSKVEIYPDAVINDEPEIGFEDDDFKCYIISN